MSQNADLKIAKELQPLASGVDRILRETAGERVNFSLFVWTNGRAQYVANCERSSVIAALKEMIVKWEAGMPDVPANKVQ